MSSLKGSVSSTQTLSGITGMSDLTGNVSSTQALNGGHTIIKGITEEVDPTVPSHVKNITEEDIENWNNKLTNTDYATSDVGGVVKIKADYGFKMWSAGALDMIPASYSDIENRTYSAYPQDNIRNATRRVIVPASIDYAVKLALTDNKLEGTSHFWRPADKQTVIEFLGIDDAIRSAIDEYVPDIVKSEITGALEESY